MYAARWSFFQFFALIFLRTALNDVIKSGIIMQIMTSEDMQKGKDTMIEYACKLLKD